MRELRYCAGGPGQIHKSGGIARGQAAGLAEGWLAPCRGNAGYLELTASGRRRLALNRVPSCLYLAAVVMIVFCVLSIPGLAACMLSSRISAAERRERGEE